MHDRVEAPVLRLQRARDVGEVLGFGRREIERQDRRLGVAGRDDLVVERFELAHDAAVQHDRRAAAQRRPARGPAKTAARAGDEDRRGRRAIGCAICDAEVGSGIGERCENGCR